MRSEESVSVMLICCAYLSKLVNLKEECNLFFSVNYSFFFSFLPILCIQMLITPGFSIEITIMDCFSQMIGLND